MRALVGSQCLGGEARGRLEAFGPQYQTGVKVAFVSPLALLSPRSRFILASTAGVRDNSSIDKIPCSPSGRRALEETATEGGNQEQLKEENALVQVLEAGQEGSTDDPTRTHCQSLWSFVYLDRITLISEQQAP